MTIFYCLRFETPQTWKVKSFYIRFPGTGWPIYAPGTGFPFRHLQRLAGLRWSYSNPPSHGVDTTELLVLVILPRHVPHIKRLFHYCVFSRCKGNSVSIKLFPSSGCCTVACLHCSLCVTVFYDRSEWPRGSIAWNIFPLLKQWDRGFESHSRHGCPRSFFLLSFHFQL
jgi:hypothetical protein